MSLPRYMQEDWRQDQDRRPTAMIYHQRACRLVTASYRPAVLSHKAVTQERVGHKEPLVAALCSREFGAVVSVDEGGTTCMWMLEVRPAQPGAPSPTSVVVVEIRGSGARCSTYVHMYRKP